MAETPEPVTGVLRSDVELIRGNPPLLFDRQADAYYKVAPEMLNILAYLTESIPVSQFREKLDRNGVSVDRETLLKLLAFLQQNNLLAPEYGHIGIKRERQAALREKTAFLRFSAAYLFFRLPPWRPERLFEAIGPYVSWLASKWLVWLLAIPAVIGYLFMIRDFGNVRATFLDSLSWAGLAKYFVAILFLKFVHEAAHSLAAIHFRCRVRGIGIGFMVFYPRLYTDTTDSWRLPRRQRLLIDAAGIIIDTNRAARRIFQINGDPRNRQAAALLRNEALDDFLKQLRKTGNPAEAEFTFPLPEGDKQLRVRGCPLRWNEDTRQGILLVFYDMTQLRKLESFRRDFIANVSHEIKTPLTVIRGAVETLLDGALDDPEHAKRFLEIIATHSERLNSLVQDILSLSQLECRALSEERELENATLSLVIGSAVKLEEPRAEEAGIRLVTEIIDDPPVRIDPQLMEQAIVNLIDNAIKHSGEKEEIRIRLHAENGFAILDVIDHGCGIASVHLERLFERFYRVDKARSRKAGGTGLGLAIVKHAMQLHHGTAEVKSRPGEGSTFSLKLPIASS